MRLIQHFGKNAFQDAVPDELAGAERRAAAAKMAGDEKHTAAEILYNDDLEKYTERELLDELRQTLIGRSVYVPTIDSIAFP